MRRGDSPADTPAASATSADSAAGASAASAAAATSTASADAKDAGDTWITAADGNRYWGRFGAAGLLAHSREHNTVLLQHRVGWSDHGNTWGIPGGARHRDEPVCTAALREANEEAGVPLDTVRARYVHERDRGGWCYSTVIAEVTHDFTPRVTDAESNAVEWVPAAEVVSRELHPGFQASWPALAPLLSGAPPVVIIDAANVMGSVPDGWWNDRHAAALRLRDRFDLWAESSNGVPPEFVGLSAARELGITAVYPNWVFVAEGAARPVASGALVQAVNATADGDSAIVSEVRLAAAAGSSVAVITSDAELRTRCIAAGAAVVHGAGSVLAQLPQLPHHP